MVVDLIWYGATGAAAGYAAGLLGIGGGVIVVPVLAHLFARQGFPPDQVMHAAVATSLATLLLTAGASARAHHKRGALQWPIVRPLVAGMTAGALFGTFVARALDTAVLQLAFAVFELLVAAQLAFHWRPGHTDRTLPGPLGLGASGGVIGTLSSILGIGGGTLTVPFLVWRGVGPRSAVGISAFMGLPIALAGTLGYALAETGANPLPQPSLGLVYVPAWIALGLTSVAFAPLGAAAAHRLAPIVLRRVFAAFLALLGMSVLLI